MLDPIPASTLILLRDTPDGAPEVLMLERGAHLAFVASRMVFPGGRIDPDDRLLAERSDLLRSGPAIERDDLVGRIAAIRETIEEIGLAPGIEGIADADMIAAIRAALHGGEPFSAIVERLSLTIDPHVIHPFARWLPEHEFERRFDTRFYVARAPEIGEAEADGHESKHCVWGRAEDHLASALMVFPTVRNLERVGQADCCEAAFALAARYPIDMVTPRIEMRDGVEWLCIPDHLGYPVTSESFETVSRGFEIKSESITRQPG